MSIYKIVIVDDEINNILILKHFVSKYCLNVEVVGQALTVSEAITEINCKQPDIVFLDVRLNESEVFEVLDKVDYQNMQVIFVTAYDEYAVKAFKYNAIDYILKPIAIEEVILAVNKAIQKTNQQHYFDFQNLASLSKPQSESSENRDYLAVASLDKIDLVKTSEIMYVVAESKYTIFHLKEGKQLTSSKNLAHYEKILDEAYFFRIHHTYLVNMRYVSKIIKKDGSYCEITNGVLIPIAKRKQDDFNRFLKIKN